MAQRTLSSQPTVIIVEPADHGSNVEGSPYGVELVICARDLGACKESRQSENKKELSWHTIGYDGSLDNRAHETRAFLEPQTLQATPDCIDEAEAGGFVCKLRVNLVIVDVVCNVEEDLVRLWANCRLAVTVMAHFASKDGLSSKLGSDSDALRVGWTAKASRELKGP